MRTLIKFNLFEGEGEEVAGEFVLFSSWIARMRKSEL